MKIKGFSLAEALITLLIVSIIALASVPVITKKNRAKSQAPSTVWSINTDIHPSISPSSNRDIKLGRTTNRKDQGIIINEILVFKDTKGKTIGWIKEDGTNSFTEEIVAKQNQIIRMLDTLTNRLRAEIESEQTSIYGHNATENSNYGQSEGLNKLKNPPKANGGITGRERILRGGTGRERLKSQSTQQDLQILTPEQAEQIAILQKQLEQVKNSRYNDY